MNTESTTPLISIVIPAHNAAATIEECLEACLAQSYPNTEVIVIDDGSTDNTTALSAPFPIRCIRQNQQGPAAARNRGAHEASGEFLVFTDSDCVPAEDWLEQLMQGFDEGVVAVGGTYGIADDESLLARMIHEEIQCRHETFGEFVDFLGSFNLAVRKSAFLECGGFDESFRAASGEDNDLSYRLLDTGGKLRFTGEAVVFHYHPTRLRRYLRTQMRHGFWRMKLYAKHPHRMRGDRYAGITDLLAPVLMLLLGLSFFLVLLGPPAPFYIGVVAGMLLTLVAVRLPVPWKMFLRTRDRRMLGFVGVMLIRDVARAIGMAQGIWTFRVLRKSTA
ncbi:MAG: glycosyltransferase [Candidatus Hydrogenedentes bacterium]|nr:glycosyltransferase [Candidatus Hydrogenedentota bacterium]